MASVILNKPYPGIATGTLLTLQPTGGYSNAGGTFWIDAATVAARPDSFLPISLPGVTFFVANGDGTTSSVSGIPNATGIKPNYFSVQADAQAAASAAAALMNSYKR